MHTPNCAHYTVNTTLCTLHCAHQTVHTTLCTLHCAHYTVHTTLCTLNSAQYSVHTTQCTTLWKPRPTTRIYRNSGQAKLWACLQNRIRSRGDVNGPHWVDSASFSPAATHKVKQLVECGLLSDLTFHVLAFCNTFSPAVSFKAGNQQSVLTSDQTNLQNFARHKRWFYWSFWFRT